MSEEADVETGLMVIEDEQENEEKGEPAKNGQSAITMTVEEFARESTPNGGIKKVASGLSEPGSSPLWEFSVIE